MEYLTPMTDLQISRGSVYAILGFMEDQMGENKFPLKKKFLKAKCRVALYSYLNSFF